MNIVSVLHLAVRYGHNDLSELLLKYHEDITGYNCLDSLLHCALLHGNIESAKLLIQRGAKINIESSLHSAVICQLPEYLNFLMNNYKHEVINYAAEKGEELSKLLMPAFKGGNLEIVKHLLDAGADVNYEDISGKIPLLESRDGEAARFLISRGANVNKVMRNGDTPLTTILINRQMFSHLTGRPIFDSFDMQFVKVLLENGASVNDGQLNGETPLMIVSSTEASVPMLRILLNHGADLGVQDKKGNTALMHAITSNHSENALFLLKFAKEKDLNVQNMIGMTALMCAALYNNHKVLKELLNYNADVNIKDNEGKTALHCAILVPFALPVMENLINLIEAGSDVNCQCDDGFSPLMLASSLFWKEGVLTLLDLGADVNAVSKTHATATAVSFLGDISDDLDYKRDARSCLLALLKRGASSSYADQNILNRAIFNGDLDVVHELIHSGLGPADIEAQCTNLSDGEIIALHISPLCAALLVDNVSLAEDIVGKLFLTNSDITSLANNKKLREVLGKKHYQKCLDFLDKMASQPMSLSQLTFVAVLSAVGTSPGREMRVKALPLPQLVKDKLLFKSRDV